MRRFVMVLLLLFPAIAGLIFLYSFNNVGNDYTEFLHRSTKGIREELVDLTSVAISCARAAICCPKSPISMPLWIA